MLLFSGGSRLHQEPVLPDFFFAYVNPGILAIWHIRNGELWCEAMRGASGRQRQKKFFNTLLIMFSTIKSNITSMTGSMGEQYRLPNHTAIKLVQHAQVLLIIV